MTWRNAAFNHANNAFVYANLIGADIEFISFFEKLALLLLLDIFLVNRTKTLLCNIAHNYLLLWHQKTLNLGNCHLAVI